jgi:hypothetical protein
MPKPTVNPILVLINCSAVLKPLKYDELEPEVWSETKLNRPPLPRPEGSWKRMPVICWVLTSEDKEGRTTDDRETYHHDKCIPFEKPAVQVRHEANSKRSNRSRNITLIREFSPHKMVCHPSYAGNGDQE